jgi:hypothetical protein
MGRLNRTAAVVAVLAFTTLALGAAPGAAPARPSASAAKCDKRTHRATGSFRARLFGSGHHPRARHRWPIRITARTTSGHALSGSVFYQFLFGGQIVACRSVSAPGKPHFRGTFRDVIRWPRRSVGVPLTLRAVVRTRKGMRNLDYAIEVRR